ncbi:murein hydrolase activator EnvC family protein [Microbacterium saperdae]
MTSATRLAACLMTLLCVLLCTATPRSASASTESALASTGFSETARGEASWIWPLAGPRIVAEPYRAPAHEYGSGHRGIDLDAQHGVAVSAPAVGVVAFRGTVVDRPLLTIEHAGGLVSTLEPVVSSLTPGESVTAGQPVGVVGAGGHTPSGAVHLGVRLDGDYINPMLLFGPVARAVLLPCCAAQ